MNQTTDTPVNRLYKTRIFAMLYQDKKELLDLYNAISGKHYEDPELLEINTLENAIYMTMRNDLSFLIDFRLPCTSTSLHTVPIFHCEICFTFQICILAW